jgi:putative inorganic carbon (HCO3(-)) transporter
MTDNAQDFLFPGPRLPAMHELPEGFRGHKLALALGLVGAGVTVLFISAHWSVALLGAMALLAFSAMESEAFLLFVMFMMPFGWMLPARIPVRNMHVLIHSLVVIGFFAGRVLRGQTRLGHLFHPVVSRASLLFLCAAIAPTLVFAEEMTHESARADLDLLAYVGFYFMVLAWVDSRQRIRKVLWAVLLSTVVTSVFAFYQEIIGGFGSLWLYLYPQNDYYAVWEGRAASLLSSANSLAGYLNLVLPFALACYVLGRGKWKKLGAYTFGLGSLALLSTQSVGGLLAFASILVLAIFCFSPSLKKRLIFLAGVFALFCVFYLLRSVLNPSHTQELVESDAVTRLLLWDAAWNFFVHSPVIGVGWGNFTALYDADLPSMAGILAAHQLYLQLLAETGLLGFVAFFYFVGRSWRQARDQLRSSRDFLDAALAFGVLGAILSVLVQGSIDFLFQVNPQFGTLFWVLLALLVANGRLQAKMKSDVNLQP